MAWPKQTLTDATEKFYELRRIAGELLKQSDKELIKEEEDLLTEFLEKSSELGWSSLATKTDVAEEEALIAEEAAALEKKLETVDGTFEIMGTSIAEFKTLSTGPVGNGWYKKERSKASPLPKPIAPIVPNAHLPLLAEQLRRDIEIVNGGITPITPRPVEKSLLDKCVEMVPMGSGINITAMSMEEVCQTCGSSDTNHDCREAIVIDVGKKKPKDAIKHIRDIHAEIVEASGPNLGTTSVTLESEDPYRTQGKQPMENVLKQAGLEHKIFVSITSPDEEWTDEQRQLLSNLNETHKSIGFLTDNGPSLALTITPEPKLSAWRRFVAAIYGAIGRTFTMPHKLNRGHVKVPQRNLPPLGDPPPRTPPPSPWPPPPDENPGSYVDVRPQRPAPNSSPFETPSRAPGPSETPLAIFPRIGAPLPIFGDDDPREVGVEAPPGTTYTCSLDCRVYVKTGETERDWSRIYSSNDEMEADA